MMLIVDHLHENEKKIAGKVQKLACQYLLLVYFDLFEMDQVCLVRMKYIPTYSSVISGHN